MLTSSRKSKGRRLQVFVRDYLYELFPHLKQDDVVSRSMGAPGVDIILSPLARDACPLSFECKNTTAQPGMSHFKQAADNAYPNTFPIVVWKPRNREFKNSMAIMNLADVLSLVKEVYELKQSLKTLKENLSE